jgi:stage II sporulation protein M
MHFRYWILFASLIFIAGVAGGVVIASARPGGAVDFLTGQISAIEKLSAMLGPFQITTVVLIFFKNALAVVLGFLLSPILCLFPIFTLALNGVFLSFVSVMVVQQRSLFYLVAGILPHGIIEIPAVIIGEAAALSFGTMAISALFNSDRRKLLLPNLKQNLKYLTLALGLLVPAAIIETFVTPLVLGK